MFRFTQEPSSGSCLVLSENYKYDSMCCAGVLYSTLAQQAGMPPWHWSRQKRRAHRIIFVVLAEHETAPWRWFVHAWTETCRSDSRNIVLIFLWFYNCVHQFGIIKYCLNTVDARYKHEHGNYTYFVVYLSFALIHFESTYFLKSLIKFQLCILNILNICSKSCL